MKLFLGNTHRFLLSVSGLDGDSPGRKAAAELMEKYYGLGYEIEDCPPPAGYKDYNEWLVATKLNLADEKKEQMTIAGQCH